MKDSLGNPDPHAYNAVHWDGSEWKVKKISVLFRGSLITPPFEGVFAFSSTDIWFVGSLPIHGDGTNWTMYDLRTTVDPNLSCLKLGEQVPATFILLEEMVVSPTTKTEYGQR